jgi:hypothetical protein
VRLLTLTGTGGTGKTTLAVEVAVRCLHDFEDGVAYVPLAPVNDPRLVISAIAQALAVSSSASESVLDAIIDHLRNRHLLLVLDNFEQVLQAASELAVITQTCPKVTTLVTSRFALNLSMEYEFPVAPLLTPDPRLKVSATALRTYPAVELFVQRAAAVKPGFGVDEESTVAIAKICQRLDGLPLAIELAAARIKIFSPRALLARLDQRLELLSGGARDLTTCSIWMSRPYFAGWRPFRAAAHSRPLKRCVMPLVICGSRFWMASPRWSIRVCCGRTPGTMVSRASLCWRPCATSRSNASKPAANKRRRERGTRISSWLWPRRQRPS